MAYTGHCRLGYECIMQSQSLAQLKKDPNFMYTACWQYNNIALLSSLFWVCVCFSIMHPGLRNIVHLQCNSLLHSNCEFLPLSAFIHSTTYTSRNVLLFHTVELEHKCQRLAVRGKKTNKGWIIKCLLFRTSFRALLASQCIESMYRSQI